MTITSRYLLATSLLLMLISGSILAACSSGSSSTMGSTSTPSTPSGSGVLFGGNHNLLVEESQLGRKLAIIRTYYNLTTPFPTATDTQALASGHTLLVSLTVAASSWSSVAAGRDDATITTFLTHVNQAAITYHLAAIYFCFHHEPDVNVRKGEATASQFVAAWQHIYQLAQSKQLNWQNGGHLHWVLILTQQAFHQDASLFWPGNDMVDIVGVDGYDAANCRRLPSSTTYVATGKATPPSQIFGAALSWASAHAPGKPIFIPEWGSVPFQNAHARANFIEAMTRFVDAHPEIGAVLYWDQHGQNNACDYRLDNDQLSLSALSAMGRDPNFQAHP